MNSTVAALAFGIAAVLAVVEIGRSRDRRLVVLRARQQVGLAPETDATSRRQLSRTAVNLGVIGAFTAVLGVVSFGAAGALAGVVPVMGWRSWNARRARKRREQLADQLAPALQLVVGHLRIGRNVMAALSEVAEDTPAPLGDLLRDVVSEVRLGAAVEEVLQDVAEREQDRHLGVVASAIGLQSRHGGSLVEILETVVETIEEEDRLRRDIRSLTADGRLSATVLLAMPPAMFVIVSLLSPGYTAPLFETPLGRSMSMAGLFLGFVGWRWLRSLGTPKVVA
ncbi:MAG: type II secretion system F family protein [Actinomycetota bacterium]|nr:type II secretion system F family protein [Actinomycetota bacterium]